MTRARQVTQRRSIPRPSMLCLVLVASLGASSERPVQQTQLKLKPLKAIARDEVPYQPVMSPLRKVVPKQATDTILIVFFQGFQKEGISAQDMSWRLVAGQGAKPVESIAFGASLPQQPVRMVGTLGKGSVFPQSDASDPLLALIFVVPRATKQIMLEDPAGTRHSLAIDPSWMPGKEHIVLNVESNGRINLPIEGDAWKVQ